MTHITQNNTTKKRNTSHKTTTHTVNDTVHRIVTVPSLVMPLPGVGHHVLLMLSRLLWLNEYLRVLGNLGEQSLSFRALTGSTPQHYILLKDIKLNLFYLIWRHDHDTSLLHITKNLKNSQFTAHSFYFHNFNEVNHIVTKSTYSESR
jgi:hypothetical protein